LLTKSYTPFSSCLCLIQVASLFIAFVGERDKEALRIVVLRKRWEPKRIPTPQFTDSWVCNETSNTLEIVPNILDSVCETVVVWRSQGMCERELNNLIVESGEMCFSRVFARSGDGRESEETLADPPESPTSN